MTYASEGGFGGGIFCEYWDGYSGTGYKKINNQLLNFRQEDNMFFIGPCLSYRGVRRDLFFTTDFTVGYYNYNSLLSRGYGLDQIKGKTFGYGLGLGLDVRLYKGLCIGAGINLLGGSLVKVTVNSKELELSDDNRINLTRLTTNLGLKLWL